MAAVDWSIFESTNYDGSLAPYGKPKFGVPGNPKKSWMKRWLREGMRRTVRAVFIVHTNDVPHFLIFQQRTAACSVPFLFGGKLQEGEAEKDGLTRLLRGFILKSKSSDSCEWKVGDLITKFWRPDFDERVYPYIPPHVVRPKEEISVFQVILPPKCVFSLREGMSISSVPIHELVRNSGLMPPLIAALPTLVTRFTLYNYVPGRPGPGAIPNRASQFQSE